MSSNKLAIEENAGATQHGRKGKVSKTMPSVEASMKGCFYVVRETCLEYLRIVKGIL